MDYALYGDRTHTALRMTLTELHDPVTLGCFTIGGYDLSIMIGEPHLTDLRRASLTEPGESGRKSGFLIRCDAHWIAARHVDGLEFLQVVPRDQSEQRGAQPAACH